jgi:hypothetical protein
MKENKQYETKSASLEDFYMSLEDIEKSNGDLLNSQNELQKYISTFETINGSAVAVSQPSRVDRQAAEKSFHSFFAKVDLLQETKNKQHKEFGDAKLKHDSKIVNLHKELDEANNLVSMTESQIVALKKKMDAAKTLRMVAVIFVMTTGIIVTLAFLNIVSTLVWMMLAAIASIFIVNMINTSNSNI